MERGEMCFKCAFISGMPEYTKFSVPKIPFPFLSYLQVFIRCLTVTHSFTECLWSTYSLPRAGIDNAANILPDTVFTS